MDFDDATSWLVREQLGVVARSQLVEAGLSDAALRWQLEHRWRILLPGVYALDRRRPTRAQREVAGLLAAGPQAALRGLTAARWWGLTCADPGDRVHVMVPSPRRTRQVAWLDVARSAIPDSGTVNRGPFQVCSPARAVLDAAQQSGSTEVAAALGIEALQRNLVTLDRLEDELCRRNQRGSALARHAVNAAGTGAWSRPEAVLLAAIARSSVLPVAWPNPELSCGGRPLITPDVWFDDVGLAVMVHSRRHHAAGPDWDQTVERDGELTELGVIVVGVTPNRIFRDLPSSWPASNEPIWRHAFGHGPPSTRDADR
ncbi:MAG: hypothetical protein IPL45_11190 [Actinomycetales bacterium]|nr:hypothetical protein [Actinomycetales bacterium]